MDGTQRLVWKDGVGTFIDKAADDKSAAFLFIKTIYLILLSSFDHLQRQWAEEWVRAEEKNYHAQ